MNHLPNPSDQTPDPGTAVIDVDLNADAFVAKLDIEGARALLLMKQTPELSIYIEPQLSDSVAVLNQMKAIIDVAIAEVLKATQYDLHAVPHADQKPN